MVAVLVIAVVLGVLQLALTVHVRHTLTSCAAEGARVAAVSTRAAGEDRGASCAAGSLGLQATATAAHEPAGALATVVVTLEAPPPPVSLWRPAAITARGRALLEEADDAP